MLAALPRFMVWKVLLRKNKQNDIYPSKQKPSKTFYIYISSYILRLKIYTDAQKKTKIRLLFIRASPFKFDRVFNAKPKTKIKQKNVLPRRSLPTIAL